MAKPSLLPARHRLMCTTSLSTGVCVRCEDATDTNPLSVIQPLDKKQNGSAQRNLGAPNADWYEKYSPLRPNPFLGEERDKQTAFALKGSLHQKRHVGSRAWNLFGSPSACRGEDGPKEDKRQANQSIDSPVDQNKSSQEPISISWLMETRDPF